MKVTTKTKDIDKGYKRIMKDMKHIKGAYALIGVHEDAGQYDNGIYIGTVAFWNEYGTETAPARPFLRHTMTQKESYFLKQTNILKGRLFKGAISVKQAVDSIGAKIAFSIQNSIRYASRWAAPNAPSTLYAKSRRSEKAAMGKGKSVSVWPLIDSRLLLRSIGYMAVIKNSKGSLKYANKSL